VFVPPALQRFDEALSLKIPELPEGAACRNAVLHGAARELRRFIRNLGSSTSNSSFTPGFHPLLIA